MKQQITFGEWLKSRRKSLGLTQKRLAEQVNCSVETIYKIEAGTRRPSVQIATLLCREFDIHAAEEEDFIKFARSTEPLPMVSNTSEQTPWRSKFIPDSNLPIQLDTLIGRDELIAQANAMLKQDVVRLITLIGAPGIGKTRVAYKLGETALLDYPDGVYLVELAATKQSDQIVAAIAQSLSIAISNRTGALNALKQYLFERHLLLILDNFEQLLDGAPIVSNILMSCPLVKIIVTSRSPLRIRGEKQLPIEPLSLPEPSSDYQLKHVAGYTAVQLFVERAKAINPAFALTSGNSTAVAAICARLDGIPLAIEIVAARSRLLQPQEILKRLSGRALLTSKGIVDADPRHRTLETAIAWSVDLLNETERNVFYRLGIFASGFTLDAATSVINTDIDVLGLLSSLVDMSLLKRDHSRANHLRFIMLETIREFALIELDRTSQYHTTVQLHATFYHKLALKMEPRLHSGEPVKTLEVLSDDHDNLHFSLDYFIDNHDWQNAIEIAGALGEYWVYRNHTLLALRYADDLLTATEDLTLDVRRAKLLNRASMAAYFSGNYDLALHYAQRARTLALAVRSEEDIAFACLSLVMSDDKAQSDVITNLLNQGFAAAQASEASWLVASLLNAFGAIARGHERYDEALQYFEDTLALSTEIGYKWLIAIALYNIGTIALAKEQHALALQYLRRSLDVSFSLGDDRGLVTTLQHIAGIYIDGDRTAEGTQLLSFAQSLRNRKNATLEGRDFIYFERFRNSARERLGNSDFDQYWQSGQLSTLDRILALAQADS